MPQIFTERGLIDLTVPAEGTTGIYATDDGFVQLVTKHEGITRTVQFTPEEWDVVALGGVKLGVVASSARTMGAARPKAEPPRKLTPELSAMISKANGRM